MFFFHPYLGNDPISLLFFKWVGETINCRYDLGVSHPINFSPRFLCFVFSCFFSGSDNKDEEFEPLKF